MNDPQAGYKRAKIAWYQIDNQLYRNVGRFKPDNISAEDLKNHYVRAVGPQEIFPNRQLQQGIFFEQIFDVAYYPRERGPYNYNPSLDNNGFLTNPEANWAGITNAIETEVDFDKANIEYVEFWLMDPFINSQYGYVDDGITTTPRPNRTGGKLIFQLGSISEDVMRDAKHAFENGLPPDGTLDAGAEQNKWGYVSSQSYLISAFDNSSATARTNQDVGLDGLPTEKEVTFFQNYLNTVTPAARATVESDPSADNFRHWLSGLYDNNDAKILERYKEMNGQDGNSPIITGSDDIAQSGSTIPDNEDLNADNTLTELEEYYEYDMDLKPDQLAIGSEYIVDKITTTDQGRLSEPVTWYLFRIPVREFESKSPTIDGFKSIKYVRMLLTGFRDPVVMRFANFRMVGSRWRRYTDNLREGALIKEPEPGADNFTVNVVNLEENAAGATDKSPYVIPPGVLRDRDNTSSVSRLLNEQSIQVCIDDLEDGDARAVYKNLSMDLFNYGKVKMFFHANSESNDDELHAFLRMGTDFDQNYYEIEIPLKITKPANSTLERDIWPEENEIDLALTELYALKAARDREGFPLNELYPRESAKQVGRHFIRIFGRPDLSSVQVLMIGVRNRKTDDKRPHSVCIWANELRVTDFDRTAGWAVSSTLSAKLADFAVVTGAFRHTTFGFGAVSSKIFERTRDETTAYDVSASINVDKLLPGNTGIKIPMFVSYENTTINPKFDPANPDLRLAAALSSFNTEDERQDYVRLIRDQTTRKSLNFTNVRKVKVNPDARSNIWDIENFSFSYAYSEALRTNFTTQEALLKQHKGSVAYAFTPKATGIEPFKDSKLLSSPWLKLIKDFNFSFMPNSLGVRLDLDRSFGKNVYRNDNFISDPNYLKYFTFNRQYNVRWNFSKNLSFDYTSRANAIIDEPDGEGDSVRSEIVRNLKKFGRMKNFDQSVTVNYTLPLDKIPVTDWLGVDYRYQVNYNWRAGPFNKPDRGNIVVGLPDSLDFQNVIQNSRDRNFAGRIDMVKLYNKIKFLKELNTPPKPQPTRTSTNPRVQQKADTVKSVPGIAKGFFRLLMSLRGINGTYQLTEGTILPGFVPSPKFFGMDQNWSAPGWGFVLGDQDPNIRFKATSLENGWLTTNKSMTTPFSQSKSQAINLRANVEPSPDLKIQIDVKKETMNSYQEIFRYSDEYDETGEFVPNRDPETGFASLNPSRTGSYRISFLSIKTAFDKSNGDTESDVFKTFEENLDVLMNRFQVRNESGLYDSTSQDVLIPAFIAAYSGKNAATMPLTPFPKTPLPNWRIDYTGLTKIPFFKNMFQSITVSHGYQSSYGVTNYSNSLEFTDRTTLEINKPIEDYNNTYFGSKINETHLPVYVISQVLISEQFAPLIGVNMRTKSRITANFQYKTKRDLSLNISNAQVTEMNSKDVSFELGFTKNNMKLPFKSDGRLIVLKNDVTFRMNVTVSDTKTIQRKIAELNTITNGNINFQLRPNVSYVVNQKLNIQLYFERTINEPQVSNSYRRATTRFGAQVRFSLAQ